MKKKILVLLAVLLLVALTIQVAFADPNPPPNPNGGSCNMGRSWWVPGTDTAPGNANGVEDEDRGMWRVHHNESHPQGYTNGADNMDEVTTAHCVE